MLIAGLLIACTAFQAEERAAAPPNFLIVLMDDVGRDKIGLYGVGKDPPPTPHLDALAAQGVVFRRTWAYHACSPTRAALLTGRYSDRTGIGGVVKPDDDRNTPLALSEHLLPEDLPGYRTTHVGKWHLGDTSAPLDHPILSGFDASIGWDGPNDYFRWNECADGKLTPKTGYFPESMAEHVIAAVTAAPATPNEPAAPFFLYYCPKLAHVPFHDPPKEFHSQEEAPAYPLRQHKAMVETIDTLLGRILASVDLTETYVFVLGDNGSPGHAVEPPFVIKKNKGSLYEGSLNVPMIVAGPGVAQGKTCEELVEVTDLFATVRELSGLGPPTRGAEDSISFAPQLRDPSLPGARAYLYVHRFPHEGAKGPDHRALRTLRWKIIEDRRAGTFELFDLDADPYEELDLVATPSDDEAKREEASDARARLIALFPSFEE
ncbi:Arylsulfatase precursor [Planctomycetes bacterium Poly30]|uniref:Arylsulfatase n=1 Tax=Saltatorellus ferox TaxID=2528018 RepID=A0A518EQW4_9BACT|nr:Arylsulfatase precursor [Planctomycetes bacterium Poly30]